MVPVEVDGNYGGEALRILRGDNDPADWRPTTANKLKKLNLSVHVIPLPDGGSEVRFDLGYHASPDWTKSDLLDLFQPRLEKVVGESLRLKSVRDVRDYDQMETYMRWLREA